MIVVNFLFAQPVAAMSNYLKRLFEFHAKPTEFLGFSVKVFVSKVLMVICF